MRRNSLLFFQVFFGGKTPTKSHPPSCVFFLGGASVGPTNLRSSRSFKIRKEKKPDILGNLGLQKEREGVLWLDVHLVVVVVLLLLLVVVVAVVVVVVVAVAKQKTGFTAFSYTISMRPDVKLTSLEVGLIELKSCVGGSMIFWELRDINLNPQKPVFFVKKTCGFVPWILHTLHVII